MSAMPRIQSVVLPILRDAGLTAHGDEVTWYSWIPDIDKRQYPMGQIRRFGGKRHERRPKQLSLPVIELTVYTQMPKGELEITEQLYEDTLEVLFDAVKNQTQTEAGYLHSVTETLGMTQFSSLFQDSWRVQGLIQLGVRPPRSA